MDNTSCALEFLQAIDPIAYEDSVRRGAEGLLAVQGADGGFPTCVGASSEPCMTAAAICGLAPHPDTLPAQERALAFLVGSQLEDGGFEPGWSRSRLHTIFRARLAACTAGPQDHDVARMAGRIERTVLETQNAGGGYGGPPGMVGPRPFPYGFPILTDAPVLLAFGHVRARIRDTAAVLQGSTAVQGAPVGAVFEESPTQCHHGRRNAKERRGTWASSSLRCRSTWPSLLTIDDSEAPLRSLPFDGRPRN